MRPAILPPSTRVMYRALAGDGDYPAIVRGRNRDRLDISIDYPGIELELTVPLYDEPREGCPRGSCYEV